MKSEQKSKLLKNKAEQKDLIEKVLDFLIVLLLILIIFLSFRILRQAGSLDNLRSSIKQFSMKIPAFDNYMKEEKAEPEKQSEKQESKINIVSKREYPDNLTEEEKGVLQLQSQLSADQGAGWDSLVKKIAVETELVKLSLYNEDCFASPVVSRVRGAKIRLVNDNERQVSFGFSGKSWQVPAKSSLVVDLGEVETGVIGFGCGNSNEPSGLILFEGTNK